MTPSAGGRVRLEAKVIRVCGEVATLQLADGQAIRIAVAHLAPAETKPPRRTDHGKDGIPD